MRDYIGGIAQPEFMDSEVRDTWVAALRSGKYPQGRFALHSVSGTGKESFCCLGVLCVLAVEAGIIGEPRRDASGENYLYGKHSASGYLPVEVQKWSGITSAEAAFHVGGFAGMDSLSSRNDTGATFATIADLIERKF